VPQARNRGLQFFCTQVHQMGMTNRFQQALKVATVAVTATVAASCQVSKSANPLSPNIAGPIAGVVINTPGTLEPGHNWQIWPRDQPIVLKINNAGSNGVRPVSYTFEVASDSNFNSIVFKRIGVPRGEPITTLQLPESLPTGRTYWWRARAEDGANVSNYSEVVSFVALVPVVLSAPTANSPSGTISTTVPEFKVGAGTKSGPYDRIEYRVEVATDPGFSSVITAFGVPEGGSETTIAENVGYGNNTTYYWRARTRDTGDSGAVSPWSSTQTFTPTVVVAPPTGGGGGGSGASCGLTDPLSILQCNKEPYPGQLHGSTAVAFLRASARDMNAAGVPGGPFGLLVKTSGNNCDGYSCDIICAGQGGSQRQYDVLMDETWPAWNLVDPGTQVVRPCEIQ
jgi:hypothetical protein